MDFSKLLMKLSLQDKRVALQGLTIPDGKVFDVNQ